MDYYTRCPHFQVSTLMSSTILLIMYTHTCVYSLYAGILVITGLLIVLGRKKSMAINTAILAAFYGLLYLCAGRYVHGYCVTYRVGQYFNIIAGYAML